MTIVGDAKVGPPPSGIEILGPVHPGSIIVIPIQTWDQMTSQGDLIAEAAGDELSDGVSLITEQLKSTLGHDKFLIMTYDSEGGPPKVIGPEKLGGLADAMTAFMTAYS